MLCARSRRHLENDVLQAGGLSSGPVNAGDGSGGGNISHVDNEVADLPVENVDCSPCWLSIGLVWVILDHGKRAGWKSETAGSLERRQAVWIADELSVVVIRKWF